MARTLHELELAALSVRRYLKLKRHDIRRGVFYVTAEEQALLHMQPPFQGAVERSYHGNGTVEERVCGLLVKVV